MSAEQRFFPYGDAEIAWLTKRDKRLGEAMARIGRIDRPMDDDLFSAVLHHIIGQQVSTKAQQTVWKRLKELVGDVNADSICSVGVERLQACGTTFRKAEYMLDFAERVRGGSFDPQAVAAMSDAEATQALSELRGIGVWTAEMILLFSLGRPNILSFGDLAIVRGMRMLYRRRTIDRDQFERLRKRFSPYGSTASLYFWAISAGKIEGLNDPAPKSAPKKRSKS